MRRTTRVSVGVLVTTFAVGALVQPAAGQDIIDATTLGAAIVAPYVTGNPDEVTNGDDQITVVTVTNGLAGQGVNLHVIVIDENWSTLAFNCPVSPLETTYFVFEPANSNSADPNSKITYECTQNGDSIGGEDIRTREISGRRGLVFIAIECLTDAPGCAGGNPFTALRTLPHNALLADVAIIDFDSGYAVSIPAIHIQSNGPNDGDRLYEFDGTEYMSFPSVLSTNFIAPNDSVSLELLLFTLDGTANDSGISARVSGLVFDDDEELLASGAIGFDCFFFEDVTQFPPNGFGPSIIGGVVAGDHLVGHIELFPTAVGGQFDSNETDPLTGDGNNARKRPVHGWIFQTIATDGSVRASWGRVLAHGTMALPALGSDTPALNANLF